MSRPCSNEDARSVLYFLAHRDVENFVNWDIVKEDFSRRFPLLGWLIRERQRINEMLVMAVEAAERTLG